MLSDRSSRLFKGGFSTGHGYLREPQSIGSYAALAAIAIQSNQNDQHGGQGVPNFDYAMAQGVAKSFARLYRRKLRDALEDVLDSENEAQLAQQAAEAGEEATGHPARLEVDAERFDAAAVDALVKTGRLDEKTAASSCAAHAAALPKALTATPSKRWRALCTI